MTDDELHGWKEIANHLRRSPRTAQRWERELGLPVRRLATGGGEAVYALKSELDEWRRSNEAKPDQAEALNGDDADGFEEEPEESEAATVAAPAVSAPARPPRVARPFGSFPPGRRPLLVLAAVAVVALAVVAMVSAWRPAARRPLVSPATEAASSLLNPGPWPTNGHDMRRTNQGDLPGPRTQPVARLLYASQAPATRHLEPVSLIDNHIVFGECGRVVEIDRAGRVLWADDLRSVTGLKEHPGGFAVDNQGVILFTTFDCPDSPDSVETHLYLVASTGAIGFRPTIGTSFVAPAIGRDHAVYTIDEVGFLRGFHMSMNPAWGTTLAGFSTGGIAVDAEGNLYVGTDGGRYHRESFFSLTPTGEVRWTALDEALGQAVVGADRVYVASLGGLVHAFGLDGRPAWTLSVGAIRSLQPLALGHSGKLYVQTAKDVVAVAPTGQIAWRFGTGASGDVARPALDRDENVYAALDDFVVSLDSAGRERWRLPLPRPRAIIVGAAHTLYVATADNRLYALEEVR